MKKVVIISPYLNSLTRGIERFSINLADALVKNGIEVVIYTRRQKQGQLCGILNSAIKVRTVPYFGYFVDIWSAMFYRLWLMIDNPEATILNFFYHGEERLPKGRKYLYILHSPASQIPQRYEYVKSKIAAFKNIHIVAISQLVQKDAIPYFKGKPMSLIYNGTDTDTFKPIDDKDNQDKFRIITPAAYEERKGMHYMIEALADCKYKDQIQYDIYGTGDAEYGNYLKSLIEKYHLENVVILKGSVNNIPEVEPQYDLFALLSKGEAFALTPIEAMACGVPILVSTYAPYPEFVKKDFGFMVNRENKEEIQAILSDLIENPDKQRKLAMAARQASLAYSWDEVVKQYISLL